MTNTIRRKLVPYLMILLVCMGAYSTTAYAAEVSGTTENTEVTMEDGTVTIHLDAGGETETKQMGTVANTNGAPLNVRTGPGMEYAVFHQLQPGETVEVITEERGWYQVTFSGQTGYVGKQYLSVATVRTDASDAVSLDLDEEMLEMLALLFMQGFDAENAPSTALTPEGNLTLVDDLGGMGGDGKQFITVSTKSGNYFYLIIDRDDEGECTVHFLNQVDERDLLTLMDEDEAAAYEESTEETSEPVIEEPAQEEPEDPAEDVETPEEPEADEKPVHLLPIAVLLLTLLGGGGVFLYHRMRQTRQEAQEKPDPDADYLEDETDVFAFPEQEGEEAGIDEDDSYLDDEPV